MTVRHEVPQVVSASREIAAGPGRIFELIGDAVACPALSGSTISLVPSPPRR
jgi:hypothetical protein